MDRTKKVVKKSKTAVIFNRVGSLLAVIGFSLFIALSPLVVDFGPNPTRIYLETTSASTVICNDGSVHPSPTEDYACLREGGVRSVEPYENLNPGDICPDYFAREGERIPEGQNQAWCGQITEEERERNEAYDNCLASGGTWNDENNTCDGSQSCEERMGIGAGWIVCSLIEALSSGMDKMLEQIDSMLNVDALGINQNDELRTVWSYFRAIATFALFAVGLVMVISQAIGGGN